MDHIEISSDDCLFVNKLTDAMCGVFENENARMYKFFELFQEYTGWKLVVLKSETSESDGSLHYLNGALYCNLEVKVEKGSGGGDPYMQCIAYYIKNLPFDAVSTQILIFFWNFVVLPFLSVVFSIPKCKLFVIPLPLRTSYCVIKTLFLRKRL